MTPKTGLLSSMQFIISHATLINDDVSLIVILQQLILGPDMRNKTRNENINLEDIFTTVDESATFIIYSSSSMSVLALIFFIFLLQRQVNKVTALT